MDSSIVPTDGGNDPSAGRPLNLRQIEVFRAIMLTGSMNAAAAALHVSQPAVSRVLALAEQRLGYPLFDRVRSRLIATQEASRLYAEVERVYGGIQRLNELAVNLGTAGSGTLHLLASASFGQRLIPRALRLFRGADKFTRVDYRSVTFDELEAYFLSGQADVGLSMQPPDHPSLTSTIIGTQPVYCIMPAEHELASRKVISPADFQSTSWIGYPVDTPLGRKMQGFFEGLAVGAPHAEVHSPMTALAFVKEGLGIALVDGTCLDLGAPESRIAVRAIAPTLTVDVWATHASHVPVSLAARRYIEALREALRQETAGDHQVL